MFGPDNIPGAVATSVAPLRALNVPWAIAGGWALDLVLGRITRDHHDVDVAIFREDQAALQIALSNRTFEAVINGERRPWLPGTSLVLPTHEIHARLHEDGTHLEFLLNERDGEDWVFRRDPAVCRPVSQVFVATASGLPALAPEVVLLYKAKAPRPIDEVDFAAVLPHLGDEPRAWLATALERCHPGHRWRAEL